MPTAVLMMIGQIEVMKITKIAEGWPSRKAASEIGSQASGGTVRSTWKIGSRPRIAQIDWPTSTPSATPTTAAKPKPMATRCRRVEHAPDQARCPARRGRRTDRRSGPRRRSRSCVGGGSVAPGSRAQASARPSRMQREHDQRRQRRCAATAAHAGDARRRSGGRSAARAARPRRCGGAALRLRSVLRRHVHRDLSANGGSPLRRRPRIRLRRA